MAYEIGKVAPLSSNEIALWALDSNAGNPALGLRNGDGDPIAILRLDQARGLRDLITRWLADVAAGVGNPGGKCACYGPGARNLACPQHGEAPTE